MFRLARYIEQLRAETGPGEGPLPEDAVEALVSPRLLVRGSGGSRFLRDLAYLWCGALLDTRFDTLLLPVLVRVRDLEAALEDLLNRRNRESGWNLPPEFFPERLASGACLVLLDGFEDGRERVERAMAAYPLCRYVVASVTDDRNAGSGQHRLDIGGLEARCVVVHGEGVQRGLDLDLLDSIKHIGIGDGAQQGIIERPLQAEADLDLGHKGTG